MVALPTPVDVEKQAYEGGGSLPLIKDGQHQSVVIASEKKDTKNGWAIVFKIVVTHGDDSGAEFNEYANIGNTNEKAVKAGYGMIANIGKALGLSGINDSSELHNKPFFIEVKSEKQNDWTNKDGEKVEGKMASKIKKFLPVPASGVPASFSPPTGDTPIDTKIGEVDTGIPNEGTAAANPFAAA